uniref:Uncharacterized protein n=1 Tax=Arundo donax TaxID=35708 RepID=A0A0A9FAT8_ARUDO
MQVSGEKYSTKLFIKIHGISNIQPGHAWELKGNFL